MLDSVPSFNSVQYHGKLMMQTWENGENLISGPVLCPHIFLVSFTSTSQTVSEAIIVYNLKKN